MSVTLKPIAHQVVVVAGAASAAGLAVARAAAARGARLVLVDPDRGALARAAGALGVRVVTVEADLADPDEARRAIQVAEAAYGGFDTFVAIPPIPTEDAASPDDRGRFDRLYWSVANGAGEAAPRLRRRGGALVVLCVPPAAGALRTPERAAHAAMEAFAAGLRGDLADQRAPVSVTLVTTSGGLARDPALVARAVLFAAEHPRRRLVVGGPGGARRLADAASPRAGRYALEAQLHPAATTAIVLGAAIAAAGIAFAIARAAARPPSRPAGRARPPAPGVQDALYEAWRSGRSRRTARAARHSCLRSGERATVH